ncbi:MAG: YdiU family protein [Gammaproteobacteria bacterium]|nr:YdiU family protein [Gammaproteobacteria bacterium]MCP4881816.1 YdiU family protein [Gammaproteobacteria bacterium]
MTPSAPQLALSFTKLPDIMYSRVEPTPVQQPHVLLLNQPLALQLGIDEAWLPSDQALQVLSGCASLAGEGAVATAYTGHQFGHQNPRLGDGRAHLLGELMDTDGQRVDVQLKGSGQTPYSRQGDGRSPLGPVLREYLVSEAMAAMGVPTTRSLAALASGEYVWRDGGAEPGAILTRIANSHIRVGSFEYAAMQGVECVRQLADYTLSRHFSEAKPGALPYLHLLQAVMAKQAQLIAQWMSLGFIHGVMNTDNMLVCGQTIDYGPCAFMDGYDPRQVYSFIDRQGRYRYDNQPGIGQWNLVRFAETLLPIMGDERSEAINLAQQALNDYQQQYEQAYAQRMAAKLGLPSADADLVSELLTIMQAEQLDYTLTFRYLMTQLSSNQTEHSMPQGVVQASDALLVWQKKWLAVVSKLGDETQALNLMAQHNPVFIPRNHCLDAALKAAYKDDMSLINELLEATAKPFAYRPQWQHLAMPPKTKEVIANTFCGT